MEIFLAFISCLLILSVLLSLVRKDFWVFKVLEYPRLQKLVLISATIAGWLCLWPLQNSWLQVLPAALLLSAFYLAYKIWPYTPLSKKEMLRVKPTDQKNQFRVFAANVLQDNRQYAILLQQIKDSDPDIIFLLETNAAWANAVKQLEENYPYQLLMPLENTYGLLFYSRLKLEKAKIMFRVKKDIPSVQAVVTLPSGNKFQLWGLHPEPPVPGESLRSTAKDKELMKVALEARDCKLPGIVIGDLNDVAWSHTTELFRKTSQLLDPRRGRGFYNTFSAHHWYIRFPLDYVFCSKQFGLVSMKRMPKNGSDHFATLTHLMLVSEIKKKQEPPRADKSELKEAKDMANQAVAG